MGLGLFKGGGGSSLAIIMAAGPPRPTCRLRCYATRLRIRTDFCGNGGEA